MVNSYSVLYISYPTRLSPEMGDVMRPYLFLLLAVALLAGCGSSSTTGVDKNEKPTISFNTNVLAVQKGFPIDLSVAIDDPDGDPLSVTWEVSAGGGSLDAADQGNPIMTWTPPPSVGSHTITATVTDGKESASKSIVLQTGTVWANDVLGGTTPWSNANSPYILRQSPGDLNFIISGGKLTIEPGVTVLIDTEEQEINVVGELEAVGTQGLPVTIKPNRRNPAAGFWKGILADVEGSMTGKVSLTHTKVSYAEYNIRADTDANATLTGCSISHSQGDGIYFRSSGTLIVDDCTISQNGGNGIKVEKQSFSSLDTSITITVTNSAIQFNGGSGVEINHQENYAAHSFIEFTGDTIAYNDFHGINILRGAYPEISDCAIMFNDIFRVNNGFNVRIDPGFVGNFPTIDARGNFWGSSFAVADSNQIASLIYDIKDNPALPRVRFVPWCDVHPCP
jgi:parallel beta-helix repeat protein